MSYQRVADREDDERSSLQHLGIPPKSPPPSFRSRTSSTAPSERHRLMPDDADRTLADTFDSPSDEDEDDDDNDANTLRQVSDSLDERQRALSGRPLAPSLHDSRARPVERRVTQLPVFAPASTGHAQGPSTTVNDGVFANLSAKPAPGEDAEEKPPTYEQAAADATPPYWETSIMAPGGGSGDEVFIDGLPVGSLFSFVWNAMISMSFKLLGFALTYLLHTT